MFDPGDADYTRSFRPIKSDTWIFCFCLAAWVLRAFIDRVGCRRDGWLITIITFFLRFGTLLEAANYLSSLLLPSKGTYALAFVLLVVGGFLLKTQLSEAQTGKGLKQTTSTNPLKPLLFPCCTSHTRLFPKKHSFAYSYLFIGVPVGWTGCVGSMVAADTEMSLGNGPRQQKAWFKVDARDHLDRGNAHLGLRGKLRVYLESQVRQCPWIGSLDSFFSRGSL